MNKNHQILVFELAGREFAIPLSAVEEVVPISKITPVPRAPFFLLGLASVRGRVVGVIDGAKRFGMGQGANKYFMICSVRGNLTAITIDRAVVAGDLLVRELEQTEKEQLRESISVDGKFLNAAYEILDVTETETIPTGRHFFEVNSDLFVSDEMAIKVGEV